MHLAIVTTYPPGTGTLNEYAYHFVRILRRKPEVQAVTLLVDELPKGQCYSDPEPEAGLAPLQIVPCWRFGGLGNAWRISRAVRRAAPDAVLFNIQFASFGRDKVSGALGLLSPALARAAGVPTVVLLHNLVEMVDLRQAGFTANPLIERAMRLAGTMLTRALLRANLVALTIPKYVELLEQKYGASNVVLAPHGSFDDAAALPDDPPSDPLRIMTFGKFGTYKRVEPLINAFCALRSPDRPALELVIAGSNSPNAPGYLEEVQARYAHVEGLRFTGYVPEEAVPGLFRESAIVVLPYTSTTGSSGVLHQAGDYGRAVVLPNVGDLAELIAEEGYAGEFFEPDDVQSLTTAIARLIDDPARRHELGRRNFMAACGLPMADVVDWYLLHMEQLRAKPQSAFRRMWGAEQARRV